MINMAASITRMYDYAPVDSEVYKTEQEKELARQKMFESMDLKSTGVITFDRVGLSSTWSTCSPRLPPWTPTSSSITATRSSSRLSIRLDLSVVALRTRSYIGTCWSFSRTPKNLAMDHPKEVRF